MSSYQRSSGPFSRMIGQTRKIVHNHASSAVIHCKRSEGISPDIVFYLSGAVHIQARQMRTVIRVCQSSSKSSVSMLCNEVVVMQVM